MKLDKDKIKYVFKTIHNIFLINNIKSHLKIKQLSCIIYLEVIGIESPIALSKNDYKK